MKKQAKEAIKSLAEKSRNAEDATEAMKYSQAALNLAQTLAVVVHTEQDDKK